jgi:hypothetical protein
MKSSLARSSDEELVTKFRLIAHDLGDAIVDWMPSARMTDRLFAVKRELRERGRETRLKLSPLLEDEDRFVRYYAARELFGLFPQKCRSIIEANTKGFDALVGDASSFLRAIDKATYKPE